MKSIRCKCGCHDHVERHRETIKTENWSKQGSGGVKLPYKIDVQVVIKECSREGCNNQYAYRCRVHHGREDLAKGDQDRVYLHPERARELMFAEKV